MQSELENLCHNIYRLRKDNNLTQKEMAKLLKIGIGSLRKLEAGIIPPRMTVDIFYHVYAAFGISPDQLVAKKDEIL